MAQYNEKPLEDEIAAHLEAGGWLYSATSAGYDKKRALFPEDVFAWLEDTQPDELAKVVKPTASTAEQAKAREIVLDRLVKTLDTPMESGGGTLNVLRGGFKHVNAKFAMGQFKPTNNKSEAALKTYGKVRVRVVRQVYYSLDNQKSIDLVLFINGIPVATIELKTDYTQSVQDAIIQYKTARLPRDKTTGKAEPLLGFGNRALVHFAVSNSEVYMTTKLAGNDTFFLPFNKGWNDGAGNPPNPKGAASSYLWEQVLERDAWLNIIGKFMHLEVTEKIDPITGAKSKSTTLVFPRYHQWDVVTRLVDAARTEGPGQRYLVQHSAGSGKTNSIAWTAHRLAFLHDQNDNTVFDSIIVITDRTILDAQLQAAIRQIESTQGIVATIGDDDVRRMDTGEGESKSKSALLAQTLLSGKKIVVVTIQTFPFALEAIRSTQGLAGKRFAIIADEAHSSQTGTAASKLKQVLTEDELADLADGGQVDTEAVLTAEMEARAESPNLSYFAFTATPKAKTIELFGRRDANGDLRAFHTYTMQQAIEEGFILDVLKNYTSYKTAFAIAQKAEAFQLLGTADTEPSAATTAAAAEDGKIELVDQAHATKSLIRWVNLHPTNVAQKVQVIVEHFRGNVAHLLDGHAKAMIVTDSRKAAVRYKKAIDDYIAKNGYKNLTALVAFSGEVTDEPITPGGPFNETNLNPGLAGRDLAKTFATPEYRVMIVANKFQTGFDQPLLVAMYVDKKLSGVTAVQTLSRLNRTYPAAGKDTTFVIDFVNDPAEVLKAFREYYKSAELASESDPNLLHDLHARLDTADIYTQEDVDGLAEEWINQTSVKNTALDPYLRPAKDKFRTQYNDAIKTNDKAGHDELDLFRQNAATFVRLYDFLSQIVNYGDTSLEKLSIYLRLLSRLIDPSVINQQFDLSKVELVHLHQHDRGTQHLDLSEGKAEGLRGVTGAGSGALHDPKLVKLAEVLTLLNDLFAGDGYTEAEKKAWAEGVVTVLAEDTTLVEQAANNAESQFLESPDLKSGVFGAVLGNQTAHTKMADKFLEGGTLQDEIIKALGQLVYMAATTELNGPDEGPGALGAQAS